VSDLRLKVTEDGLQKLVLLVDSLLIIQDLLHLVVLSTLCVKGKLLKFACVFGVVEDGLG